MAFTAGGRSNVTGIVAAKDLYNLIANQLTIHPNWTFVEEYVSGAYTWEVWVCSGAGNVVGMDYYALFNFDTTANNPLRVGVAEAYDVSTHSFSRPVPRRMSCEQNSTPAADGSWSASSFALGAWYDNANLMLRPLNVNATAYDYWLSVNNSGLMLASANPNKSIVVVGLLESLIANPPAGHMPLAMSDVLVGSYQYYSNRDAYAGVSRHPAGKTLPYLFALASVGVNSHPWPGDAVAGTIGSSGDAFQGGKPVGARLSALTYGTEGFNGASAADHGRVFGLWRDILYFNTPAAIVTGDTMTVGNDTYFYMAYNTWYNISIA